MTPSFMELYETLLRNIRTSFRTLAIAGMRKPDPNHLFGRRRHYASPATMQAKILEVMSNDQNFLRSINQELYSCRELMVMGAVVDNEVRLNVYRVDYDESNNHRVGEIDLDHDSIATFLINRQPGVETRVGKLDCQPVHQPHRFKRYNPYQTEFSWSIPLIDLDEDFLHTSPFSAVEC